MKIIAIILSSLVSLLVHADELDVAGLLSQGLGEQISIISESEIHYCPDNTCDIYKASDNFDLLPTYVYLHIIYGSTYTRLYRQHFIDTAKNQSEILAEAMSYCNESESSPKCALEGLASKLGLTRCTGRYDEGYFCHSCNNTKNVCKKL